MPSNKGRFFMARIDDEKKKIKDKIVLPDGELRLLSAQDFASLTDIEIEALKLAVQEAGKDYTQYIDKIKRLFPATVEPKLITWRKR